MTLPTGGDPDPVVLTWTRDPEQPSTYYAEHAGVHYVITRWVDGQPRQGWYLTEDDGAPTRWRSLAQARRAAKHRAGRAELIPEPERRCWCGGEVGEREPGDEDGLGCLENLYHDWADPKT